MQNKILTFRELKKAAKLQPQTPEVKIALLGDTATQFLAKAIEGACKLQGINAILFEGEYNQVERQILDSTSELYDFNPEYTIIFQSTHKLLEKYSLSGSEEWGNLAKERLDFVRNACESLPGKIICFNYAEIDDSVFGSYANKVEASFLYQLRKLNVGLMDLSIEYPNLSICDLSSIQNKIGRERVFDASIYISTEMVLSSEALAYVAARLADTIAAIEGRFKKCLILDLDNTVWGGVVGDDGWEHIQVGHDLGIGKAFSEFQQWVKKLRRRGIIICVCSKNNEDTAKEPFEKNPEMVLKLDDISVFVANWDNKADNIRIIQQILNIGFDSMVFLDDNPFERNMVRENVPGVCVPELPEDPAQYLEFLYSQNLFETASYSSADKDRTLQYQTEAKRVASAKKFANEDEYLESLNMTSEVSDFNSFNTPRVAQLSQRSNQFNLRTVRYTEDDVKAIIADPKAKGFAFTLSDKFGDNGLIAVVILREYNSETLFIDTWFMSCRVLKRGMETFTLNTIGQWAKENGYRRLIGEYLPTAKNSMVSEHYPALGFERIEGVGTAQWSLDLDSYVPLKCHIKAAQ